MSVFVTICAALTVSMVALCYADLSSRFTGSGAAWLYSYHAFGRFTGYELGIYTWFLWCCTYAAEIVALLTILKTLSPVFSNHAVHYGIAIGIIVLFTIINLFGRTIVKLVDNLSSATKMITILIFIIIGAFFIHKMNFTPVIPKAATLEVLALTSNILVLHLVLCSTCLLDSPLFRLPQNRWIIQRKIFPKYWSQWWSLWLFYMH